MKTTGNLTRITNALLDLMLNRSPEVRLRVHDGDRDGLETPEQQLLRRRIRTATAVMFVVKVAFMIRSYATFGPPPVMDYAIVSALLATSAWLYSPRNASLLALRSIETTVFLGLSIPETHEQMADYAQRLLDMAEPLRSVFFVKNSSRLGR